MDQGLPAIAKYLGTIEAKGSTRSYQAKLAVLGPGEVS